VAARLAALAALIAALFFVTEPARACAPAPHEGERVSIASEEALIVWNAQKKVEHFVRRASFRTESRDFGFLVPTPSQPKLGEAADDVFERLHELVKPEIILKKRYSLEPTGFLLRSKSEASAVAAAEVRVLDSQRVAGLDATVLEADSATALGEWLKQHDYSFRKELVAWLEPYVAAHWKITAFKIARGEAGAAFGTKAVRMSFETERPFYPYREPSDQGKDPLDPLAGGGRKLGVFFVAAEPVDGSLDRAGGWPGRATWAGGLEDAASLLAGVLGAAEIPRTPWLTSFEDRSDPRPGSADVFFARAADQSTLRPPPVVKEDVVTIPVPVELVALVVLLGFVGVIVLGVRFLRRRT